MRAVVVIVRGFMPVGMATVAMVLRMIVRGMIHELYVLAVHAGSGRWLCRNRLGATPHRQLTIINRGGRFLRGICLD